MKKLSILFTILFFYYIGIIAQPANDNCSGAFPIGLASDCSSPFTFDNSGATDSPDGFGFCGYWYQGGDIWFSLTIPVGKGFTLQTLGLSSNEVTYMIFYTGSCGSLTELTCLTVNDEIQSSIVLDPGTYSVRMFYYPAGTKIFDFCLLEFDTPPNDNCGDATPVAVGTELSCTSTIQTVIAANSDGPTPSCTNSNSDIWFEFIAPSSGNVLLEKLLLNSKKMTIYSGSCGSLTELGCDNEFVYVDNLTPGSTYLIQMSGINYDLDFCLREIGPTAINDNCNQSITVAVETGDCEPVIHGYTFTSSQSSQGAPECLPNYTSDIWFDFIAPTTGNIILFEQDNDAGYFEIFENTCGGLQSIICKGFAGSKNVFGLDPGQSYKLRIASDKTYGYVVDFCIKEGPAAPSNNTCSNAENVTLGIGSCGPTITANFGGANNIDDVPLDCPGEDYYKLWYKFTAPSNGSVLLETAPSSVVYYVFYDALCNNSNFINCGLIQNDDIAQFTGLTSGDTYYLKIMRNNSSSSVQFCLQEGVSPPSNDECSGAIASNFNVSISGVLDGATDSGVSSPYCGDALFDVWYSFTSPPNGNIEIQNDGDGVNFSVYDGACGNLNEVMCLNHYTNADFQYNGLLPNSLCYIKVWPDDNELPAFDFKISNSGDSPPNDDCSGAIPLSIGVNTCLSYNVSTNGASRDEVDPSCYIDSYNSQDIWYEFTAPSNGNLFFEYTSSSSSSAPSNIYISIYDNCGGTEFFCNKANNNSSSTEELYITGLNSSQPHMMKLWTSEGYFGNLNFCLKEAEDTPVNDYCINAINLPVISSGCSSAQLTSNYLTHSGVSDPSCYSTIEKDGWYKFEATSTEYVIFEVNESSAVLDDIRVSVYSGNCGSLIEIDCFEPESVQTIEGLINGQLYYIRIMSTNGDDWEDIDICFSEGPPPPPNDLCINSIEAILMSSTIDTIFSYTNLSTDSGEPNAGCDYVSDIWYHFTAPATGAIQLEHFSSNFIPYFKIYDGNCNALETVTDCASLYSDPVIGGLISGEEYFIRMWNKNEDQGSINWRISKKIATDANDACIGAIKVFLGNDECGPTETVTFSNSTFNKTPSCETESFINNKESEYDLFYKFSAPASGQALVDVLAYDWDLNYPDYKKGGLIIYENSCGDLQELVCMEYPGGASQIALNNLTPSSTYYLMAYSNDPGNSMSFCLNAVPPSPSNNTCAGATTLPLSSDDSCGQKISGSTYGATNNLGDCTASSEEVFYTFLANSDANYHLKLSNYLIPVGLSIYEGNCPTQQIACGEDELVVLLEAGTEYTIVVYTLDNTQSSGFDLCIHPFESSPTENNVGINVTTPIQKLQINGAIMVGDGDLPAPGSIRYRSGDFEGYSSNGWVTLSGNVVTDNLGNHLASQVLNMNSSKITNLGYPISGSDAASKSYVDEHTDEDASISNEIQTLSINGNNLDLSNGGGSVALPISGDNLGNHIATKNLSMSKYKITNLALPTKIADAASKLYVDQHTDGDSDPNNEIQTWSTLNGKPSGFSDNIDDVNDADSNPSNELNTVFTLFGDVLKLKDSGGTFDVDLSSFTNYWTKDVNDDLRYFDGDVMIGSNIVPSDKLHIENGGLDIVFNSTSTNPHIEIQENDSSDGARLTFTNSINTNNKWTLWGRADNTVSSSAFNLSHTTTGNIISALGNGDVGLGGNPNINFHVFHGNNGGDDGMKLQNTNNDKWIRMYVSSGSGDLRFFSTLHGTSIIGAIDDDTGTYTAMSDARKKTDFNDLIFDWKSYMQLKPLTYRFKNTNSEKLNVGMTAQNVNAIYPELVKYFEEEDLYHLNYSGIGVVAVKATQELYGEITELEEEINELKNQLKGQDMIIQQLLEGQFMLKASIDGFKKESGD